MRLGGARRSENVGTSSEIKVKNLDADLSEVSWATVFDPGLVGPKPRPQGVGDGQQVNIPVLFGVRPRQVRCVVRTIVLLQSRMDVGWRVHTSSNGATQHGRPSQDRFLGLSS